MKVYVETNPETIYSGRVKDEVKTTEIRMWFETDEEIEVLPISDYTKQVRKEVFEEIRNKIKQAKLIYEWKGKEITIENILDQLQESQGEKKWETNC